MSYFEAQNGDTTSYLSLKPDGKIFCSEDCSRPYHSGGWYGSPIDNLHSCICTLDRIAKSSPEIYRAVYEHVKQRTEQQYIDLAQHCKIKNNELAQKFQIID